LGKGNAVTKNTKVSGSWSHDFCF